MEHNNIKYVVAYLWKNDLKFKNFHSQIEQERFILYCKQNELIVTEAYQTIF